MILRRLFLLTCLLLLGSYLSGCGGSAESDFNRASGQPGGAQADANGVIQTANFSVAEGETMRVDRDLAVFADQNIDIDGTLQVAPGVSLSLFAGADLNVTGQIVPAPGALKGRGQTRLQGELPPDFPITLTAVQNVRVSGTIEGGPNQSILICVLLNRANTLAGTVTISGSLTGGPGEAGTDPVLSASSGGDIEIGTFEAVELTKFAVEILADGGSVAAAMFDRDRISPPRRLVITGSVRGGTGGRGFTSTEPPSLVGGPGGPGGRVAFKLQETDDQLASNPVQITPGSCIGGAGGKGGNCGPARGSDGLFERRPGGSIQANTGRGGRGGDVINGDQASLPLSGLFVPGPGGPPGDSMAVGGNGGLGSPGGNSTINVGAYGLVGNTSGAPFQINPVRKPGVSVTLQDGGNGGPGTSDSPGGKGGSTEINLPEDFRFGADPNTAPQLTLLLRNYANGGPGIDDCPSGPLPRLGVRGGDSGVIFQVTPGLKDLARDPNATLRDSLNGGDGGDSDTIPGAAGAGFTSQTLGGRLVSDVFDPLVLTIDNSLLDGRPGGPCGAPADPNQPGDPVDPNQPPSSLISFSGQPFEVTHTLNTSPCPQTIGGFQLTNLTDQPVEVALEIGPLLLLPSNSSQFTLAAGQSASGAVLFPCGLEDPAVINDTLRVSANSGGLSQMLEFPVAVTIVRP